MKSGDIRQLRLGLGYTQLELANQIGVTPLAVSNWERGRAMPERATQKRLENFFAESEGQGVLTFRPIQYLGSKARLANQISELLKSLITTSGPVVDLFSGSAVVSSVLSQHFPVVAVDTQAYATTLAEGVLRGRPDDLLPLQQPAFLDAVRETEQELKSQLFEPLCSFESQALLDATRNNPNRLSAIIEGGSVAAFSSGRQVKDSELLPALKAAHQALTRKSAIDLTATYYFGGPYFSYSQAIALDAVSRIINSFPRQVQLLANCVLLSAASTIVATVGKQFAQPMRIVKHDGSVQPLLLQRAIADRSRNFLATFLDWTQHWRLALQRRRHHHNSVLRGDAASLVDSIPNACVFYADPPYTIDHYSRFYHVLETLTLRDSPQFALDHSQQAMRGLYRLDRYQSSFCIPSQVRAAFESLFSAIANTGRPLLLSYSSFNSASSERPRLLQLSEIRELATKYFAEVTIFEAKPHSHRKLNARELNTPSSRSAEHFVVCRS